jgi:serine/threonine protein kinase
MHPGPDAFLQQVVGDRWRLLEVLSAKEDSATFRVETLDDGRRARLELWDRRRVERRGELARFEREARTLSRLRHARFLSVVAFGAHEGQPFLVSDLPEGKPLRDELGKPELTVARALSIGLQLCEGVRYLHGYGAIHQALLPENVWVTQSPAGDLLLKIGLPRIGLTTDSSDTKRERWYLPPEHGAARRDQRADLYAVGMLLYVMCTGREPPGEVIAATAGGAPVPPPRAVSPERGIREGLERVILRAVAASPAARFGTADELMAALQSAGARPTAPKRRPAQRPRKRTAMVAAAFATIAVLGAGALRVGGSQGASTPPAAQAAQHPSIRAKSTIAPPTTPPAPIAAPPVEVDREDAPATVPARAAQAVTTTSGAPSRDERSEIWSLLEGGRLNESAARIKSLLAADPEAAWPRFALGVLYYHKYWRSDSVRQWRLALAEDPEIQHDPQFGAYLCFMLDGSWKAAGATDLLNQLGAEAVPLLDHCVASAETPRLRSLASRALDGLRRSRSRARR